MRFQELAVASGYDRPKGDVEIQSLSHNSREKKQGALFFCLRGKNDDGHAYFADAMQSGAVAFVVEKPLPVSVPQIVVPNARVAMAKFSKVFFQSACDSLRIVMITGTNGKTSTSFLIRSILEEDGIETAVIGTLGASFRGENFSLDLTTPDPIQLHELFQTLKMRGAKAVVMEASAHALALKKLDGIFAEVGVFTNLSRDHLDDFKTMEKYASAKRLLFQDGFVQRKVINIDDEFGQILATENGEAITYSLKKEANVFARFIEKNEGISLEVFGFPQKLFLSSPLFGQFNGYNILAATACAKALGCSVNAIERGISSVFRIPGRFECFQRKGILAIIDFAHTPDSLKMLLESARKLCRGKLRCVFGCGGNRDRGKRKLMGEVAGALADEVVITSDNPRFEDPVDIMNEIETGVKENALSYVMIEDRARAIAFALSEANKGDVVVIAGKGHEEGIERLGKKTPHNDAFTVKKILEGLEFT